MRAVSIDMVVSTYHLSAAKAGPADDSIVDYVVQLQCRVPQYLLGGSSSTSLRGEYQQDGLLQSRTAHEPWKLS